MSNYVSQNTEIIRVAESVASEKGIPADSVIEAIEQGMKVAARKKYGAEYDIHVNIDRKTGEFKIFRRLEIVDNVEDSHTQISMDQVKESAGSANQEVKIGDHVTQDLPAIDLKRLVAQVVKQVIIQKVRVAEKEKQYDAYKDKAGEIVNGIVKKVSAKGVLLDIGGEEAFLSREDSIPGENLTQNERVRACIKEVVRKDTGVQIYLSRTSNEFMKKLFMQEVPEIYDGIINIKAVSREPGSRAKVAVQAVESNLDPVGACVGVRGSRVQVVIHELKGEKIDIIEWSSDPAAFVVNSLVPAQVLKVVIDEENNRIETVVSQKDYSIAIGRRGQNARLASRLTGWNINILTEEEEESLRKDETEKVYNLFVKHLGLDDISARVLISEGISEIDELLQISAEDLSTIEGLTEEIAKDLVAKVKKFSKSKEYLDMKWEKLGLNKELLEVKNIDANIAQNLSRNGVNDVEKLADLSRDEFKDVVPSEVLEDDKKIDDLIMSARSIAYK